MPSCWMLSFNFTSPKKVRQAHTAAGNRETQASYTPEEEVQVLLAYADLCKTGEKVALPRI